MSHPRDDGAHADELRAFRAHLAAAGVCQRNVWGTYARGARELLTFLAARGKTAAAVVPEDLRAFDAWARTRERGSLYVILGGARAYLRMKACLGELAVDEALFFALSPRIAGGTRAAGKLGDSFYARVLRELALFEEALVAQGRGLMRRRAYERAVVKLHFFLARRGKDLRGVTLGDWVAFQEEVRAGHALLAAQQILAGTRAYLQLKGKAGEIAQEAVPPRQRAHALAQLRTENLCELRAFEESLRGSHTLHVVYCYSWGVRELLIFLEREGRTAAELTAASFQSFCQELHAKGARGEVAGSRVDAALCGVRLYLRQKARHVTLDEDLLPWIAPSRVATLHELYARQDPQSAELVREVEDFQEQRAKLGYQKTAKAWHGARLLLRFLRARGRELHDVTRADFKDFSTHVLQDGGHCYTRPEPLLIGAAAYLRMKARAGVIGEDQVPKYERRRAVLPALPEALQEGLRVLGQAMQAGDFAATTRPTYRRALRDFFVWINAEQGITTLGEVTRDVITAYRLHLQSEPSVKGEPYALHTQVGILTALRFFFGWLVKTGGLLSDPTVHLPYLRRPKHLPKAMKAAELARLIARQPRTLLGLRDRALLELLYGTGMRRSEVSRLRIDDVDLDERVILIRQGKGRKDRVVPLGKRAKAVLLEYLEEARPKLLRGDGGGAFFVGRGGRLFSESAVTHRVIQLGRRLGLNLGPHVLRHSCATHLLRGRADIRHIQRLLGHESLATTERYTKVEVQDLRAVIQRCHPRERQPKA